MNSKVGFADGSCLLKREIQVLLINLTRRPDRLTGMTAQLQGMGIPFDRLEAVDGAEGLENRLALLPQKGPIGKLSVGTRACTASHLNAMRLLLAGPSEFALILEDDVEILPELNELINNDSWLQGSVDILKLEKFNPKYPSKLLLGPVLGFSPNGKLEFRSMYSRHTGSAGYIISRRGAEAALSFDHKINIPIDHFLFNETVSPLFKKLRPAILVQPILWQSEKIGSKSSIASSAGCQTSWSARKLRSITRGFLEMRLIFWQIYWLTTQQAKVVTVHTPFSKGHATPKILRRFFRL